MTGNYADAKYFLIRCSVHFVHGICTYAEPRKIWKSREGFRIYAWKVQIAFGGGISHCYHLYFHPDSV